MSDFREIIRVAGADLDGNRGLYLALKKIRGVDFMFSNALIKSLKMDKNKRAGELNEKEVKKIEDAIDNPEKYSIPDFLVNRRKDIETGENKHIVSSDLQLTKEMDIRRFKKIKSYRGIRHGRNLPVRGQRTKAGYTHPPVKRHRREVVIGVKKKKKAAAAKKKEGKK